MLRWIRDKIRLRRRVSAHWNVLRLNRWIKMRRAGMSREDALARSFFLSPEALFDVIEQGLDGALGQVGVFTLGRGAFSGGGNAGQITLLLRMMIDLVDLPRWDARDGDNGCGIGGFIAIQGGLGGSATAPSSPTPPPLVAKTKAILAELEGHNWGLVRRAVDAARKKALAA